MILYAFVLRQLNPIQKGIQMAHMFGNMFMEYGSYDRDLNECIYKDTIVLLDGGDANEMEHISELANLDDNNFCTTNYRESSLSFLLTCVGVVCPKVDPSLEYKTAIENYIATASPATF
jgi:hypothetical protein